MMGSVLSFPDRGHWGDSKWRGNASGHVYKALFEQLRPDVFVDPMVGSGTSVEVANEMGIEAHGLDLHSGFDALTDSIEERIGKQSDLVFSHPPYHQMVRYSGHQWGAEEQPNDLSHCPTVEDFNEKMAMVLMNQRQATRPGGFYGALIGDMRRGGKYYSFQAELIARMPRDELAAVVIKQQHNHMSGFKSYRKMKLPMIEHEYILLWQSPAHVRSMLFALGQMAQQSHERTRSAWKVVVHNAIVSLGGKATLSEIYDAVAKCAPANIAANPDNWQPKVRQVVQKDSRYVSEGRGCWAIAA